MQPADTPLPNPTPKGVSCYPRAGANPKPEELESCAVKYDAELKAMGFDLRKWTDKAVRAQRRTAAQQRHARSPQVARPCILCFVNAIERTSPPS